MALAVYGAVGLAALLAYINSLRGELVHDDIPAVAANPDVTAKTPLANLFANDFWGTRLLDPNSHMSYRPITTLSFRLNYLFGGLEVIWFHLFNVLLHVLCTLLFTRVSCTVAPLDPNMHLTAGLLFALHPIHTEAVSGIVGRADVLASVFFLLSFLVYHDASWSRGKERVLQSILLATLSMLAKETGLTVLAVNLIFDIYKSWPYIKRTCCEAKWNEETVKCSRRAAKLLVAMAVLLTVRLALQRGSIPRFSSRDNPAAYHPSPRVRLMTFCYLGALNLWLLVCPSTLSHDWQMGSIPLVTSPSDWRNVATLLLFSCCLILAYRCIADFESQRQGAIVLGSLMLTIPFIPASNLFLTVGFVIAERVLYLPSMGVILLMCGGAQCLMKRHNGKQRSAITACFFLLLALYAARTIHRNKDWATRESLAKAGLKSLPHNAKMHYNMGNLLRDTNYPEQAAKHYREAIRLWPTYACAHNNLGTLMKQVSEAEFYFKNAINISPGHVNAHYNLGQVYRRSNRTVEAVKMLERCLSLNGGYTAAYLVLATLSQGAKVGRLLRQVISLHPTSPDYLAYYADWLLAHNRWTEAYIFYDKALRLKPDHLVSIVGAARALRAKGQTPRLHQLLIRSLKRGVPVLRDVEASRRLGALSGGYGQGTEPIVTRRHSSDHLPPPPFQWELRNTVVSRAYNLTVVPRWRKTNPVNQHPSQWKNEEMCGWKKGDQKNRPKKGVCNDYFSTVGTIGSIDQVSSAATIQPAKSVQTGSFGPASIGSFGPVGSFGSSLSGLYERDRIRSPGSL